MTTSKLAKRKTLESQASRVIEMLLDGATEQSIADALGATKRGVQLFKARHASLLSRVRQEAVETVQKHWIAGRDARLTELQWLFEQSKAEATEYGLTVVEKRTEVDGDTETVIETRDYRGQMVKEMRGILRDAATEMGQIVTPRGDGINIDKAVINIFRGAPELGV